MIKNWFEVGWEKIKLRCVQKFWLGVCLLRLRCRPNGSPGRPRQAQTGPDRPRQAQTSPGRPRHARAGPVEKQGDKVEVGFKATNRSAGFVFLFFNYPSIHPSIHPFTHAFMYPCIHASVYPCINAPMHPCTYAPMHLCIHVAIHLCMDAPMQLCTHASMQHYQGWLVFGQLMHYL